MHVISVIRDWLVTHIPSWSRMTVIGAGKYLGFLLGPAASDDSWRAPVAKWRRRVAAIREAGLAPSLGITNYNTRVEPVLGYVGQLLPPPSGLRRLELHAAHRVLHAPGCVLPHGALMKLKAIGLPNFRSAYAACHAALVRTAISGAIHWDEQWRLLAAAAEAELPLASIARGLIWAPHWKAPAFVTHLRAAASGELYGNHPRRAARALRAAVAAGQDAVESGRPASLQRAAYAAFVQVDSEMEMSGVLRRKFNTLFACNWPEEFGARLVRSIAELSAQSAAHALRFFSNA